MTAGRDELLALAGHLDTEGTAFRDLAEKAPFGHAFQLTPVMVDRIGLSFLQAAAALRARVATPAQGVGEAE